MIPIVPLPVFTVPDWDPVFGRDLRASNADRDIAADMLCAAVADGRLTLAELDERLEDVLSARTIREIARRIADIPGPPLPVPASPAGIRSPAGTQPARPRPPAETRWSLLQSLLAGPATAPGATLSPAG
jgi:Domain of unknown function (DUF1707)